MSRAISKRKQRRAMVTVRILSVKRTAGELAKQGMTRFWVSSNRRACVGSCDGKELECLVWKLRVMKQDGCFEGLYRYVCGRKIF